MVGQRFVSFGRRGKFMLLGLEGGDSLIVHLRMTGKLLIQPPDARSDKHTHVVLMLDDDRQLHYNDARKFGRLWLVHDTEPVLQKLGPEPFGGDFTDDWLAARLSGRKASIKALLLDQAVVAGVGNIYADEALFGASIHPARMGGTLESEEVERLVESVQEVLGRGIERRGSSLGDSGAQNYVRPGGESGGFQEEHKSVSADREALSDLRHAGRTDRAGPAQHPLLPRVPGLVAYTATSILYHDIYVAAHCPHDEPTGLRHECRATLHRHCPATDRHRWLG